MIDVDLLNALQDLLDAVPKQSGDADWWDDDLHKAVRNAKALIQKREEEMEAEFAYATKSESNKAK